jgi:hypothetical protein
VFHITASILTSWPSGLRRNVKAVVFVGVGSNPTDVILFHRIEDGESFVFYGKHVTWDNYFSGCTDFKYLGEKDFRATMTCCRNPLPKEVPERNLHKKKTDLSARPKAAQCFSLISATDNVPAAVDDKKGYQYAYTFSFQSTSSSCKIFTVNALNSCKILVQRGKGG